MSTQTTGIAAPAAWARRPDDRLSDETVGRVDAWRRAASSLSVGRIHLLDDPLLREPLATEHVEPRLRGHRGTTPGLDLPYAHLDRAIAERDARIRAREYTREHGEDIPDVRDRVWPDVGETGTEGSGPASSGQTAGATATGGDNE